MSRDALALDDVTVCYRRTPAVHHLSATLRCGTLTALMGPNGAGKSTLLRAILGWQPLTTGSITLGGVPARRALARISYLPQRSAVDWDFPITVREVVAMGRYQSRGLFARFTAADHDAVADALTEMDLAWLQDRQIAQLSGGQQQRTFLARAVASGADVFLLDEPFVGLDPTSTADLVQRLNTWAAQGRLVVAVVHDVALARAHFQEALLVARSLVAAGPVAATLADANLARAYGAAWPLARPQADQALALPDLGGVLRTQARSAPRPTAQPGTSAVRPAERRP